MLLAIDIGNTNITIGLFDAQKLQKTWRVSTDSSRTSDEYGLQISNMLGSNKIINDNMNIRNKAGFILIRATPIME